MKKNVRLIHKLITLVKLKKILRKIKIFHVLNYDSSYLKAIEKNKMCETLPIIVIHPNLNFYFREHSL